MCGIFGIIRHKPQMKEMIKGLQYLEYRGYDSFGIGYPSGNILSSFKSIKKTEEEENQLLAIKPNNILIGHTRWSTASSPSMHDCHPIYGGQLTPSDTYNWFSTCFLVHNGIIENASELKEELKKQKYSFWTNTDTEVIAHLLSSISIDYYQNFLLRNKDNNKNEKNLIGFLMEEVKRKLYKLKGTYSCIFYHQNFPNALFLFNKNGSLWYSETGYIGSDFDSVNKFALRHEIQQVYNDDIVILKLENNGDLKNYYYFAETKETKLLSTISTIGDNSSLLNEEKDKKYVGHNISITINLKEKSPEEHLMLKEIKEQPDLIRKFVESKNDKEQINLNNYNEIIMFGCGSSYNAALLGRKYFHDYFNKSCFVEYASEFPEKLHSLSPSLFIAITQSGETRDVISVMQKMQLTELICLTNNLNSLATKYAKKNIDINAEPELAVAATKSFTMQVINLYWLGYKNFIDSRSVSLLDQHLFEIADSIEKLFDNQEIQYIAKEIVKYQHMIYLGTDHNHPVALEGALKMKEIAYIHAEGMPAAEFKHGPLALIDDNTLSVFLMSPTSYKNDKVIGNIQQIKARGGKILLITYDSMNPKTLNLADWIVTFDSKTNSLKALVNNTVLQLLSYYVAKEKKLPIDKPRFLAKSISVY